MRLPSNDSRNLLAAQVEKQHGQLLADGADGPAISYLAERGIDPASIERFQLGYDGRRLVIPYLTPAGPLLTRRRCITCASKCEGHARYLDSDGAETHLFNAQTLRGADRVVVTEGELDAISVEQAGISAVGYPGAQRWMKQPHFRWCFDSLDEVIVVCDGDEPEVGETEGTGEKAGRRVAKSLRDALPDVLVTVAVMPVGHDSNSFIKQHGVMDFVEKIGWV